MHRSRTFLMFLCAVFGATLQLNAQIDPNKPRTPAAAPKAPAAAPPAAYITIGVDVAAEVFINGAGKGSIAAGQSRKFTCKPGAVEVRVVDSGTRYEHVEEYHLEAKENKSLQVRLKADQEAKAAEMRERERREAEAARRREKEDLIGRFNNAASYGNRSQARSIAADIESRFPGSVHDCGACDGSGRVVEENTCGRCRGEGCRMCRECGGSGQLSCSSCGGSGNAGFGSCFSCGGKGMKGCNCICTKGGNNGLRAVAYGLGGKSEGYTTCDSCWGEGSDEKETDCRRCGGVGKAVY